MIYSTGLCTHGNYKAVQDLGHLRVMTKGGRYQQKYKSFKWFRQTLVGSCVGYEIAQTPVTRLLFWRQN